MTSPFWPGTNIIKSQQSAFTAHLTQPRSELTDKLKGAKTGPKPQSQSRYQQDARKAAIYDLRGTS